MAETDHDDWRKYLHWTPYVEVPEREFTFQHHGFPIDVTIWNEGRNPQPHTLFDFNNVLNVYTLESLRRVTGNTEHPYAIVSLLITKGKNFQSLKERAFKTGETIVALTVNVKGDRFHVESGMKRQVMELLGWTQVDKAVDDKPHEWIKTNERVVPLNPRSLSLLCELPSKSPKPIYLITVHEDRTG